MMTDDAERSSDRWAVRTASNPAEERALAGFLANQQPRDVVEFAPRNDEDLDSELCAGRFRRVLFGNLDALLAMVWKGQARVDRWIEAGVRIELAEAPVEGGFAVWGLVLSAVCDSFSGWRRGQRVRKLVAAVVLSILALMAAAVLLLWLVPPGRSGPS